MTPGAAARRGSERSWTYTDSRGRAIAFPLGDASFADEIVSFEVGKPAPRGGTATIDIAKVVKPGDRFRYVRLTDLKRACGGPFAGADLDAVGAIGSTLKLSFDASVLFDFNRSELRPEAQAALSEAATRVAAYTNAGVTVEGHTDNVGTSAYNAKLSLARAAAVRAFLLSRPELRGRTVAVEGFGAGRPIALNDTEEGRQQNRRVEILVTPRP